MSSLRLVWVMNTRLAHHGGTVKVPLQPDEIAAMPKTSALC